LGGALAHTVAATTKTKQTNRNNTLIVLVGQTEDGKRGDGEKARTIDREEREMERESVTEGKW
jgi:hypothetical protein